MRSIKDDLARFISSSCGEIYELEIEQDDFEKTYLFLKTRNDIQFGIAWEYQADEPLLQFVGSQVNIAGGHEHMRQLIGVINGIGVRTKASVCAIQDKLLKRGLGANATFDFEITEILERCGLV